MKRFLLCAASALLAVAITGCSAGLESGGTKGDCAPRVRYQNTVYLSNDGLNQHAPMGKRLGRGDLLDCDGKSFRKATIRTVRGVGIDLVVAVDGGDYHGVYLSPDAPSKRSWPEQIRAPR